MELIGQTIEARAHSSRFAWVWAACGLALLGFAVAIKDVNPAMIAVFPLMLAAILFLRRHRTVQFSIDQRGLRLLGPGELIPYDMMMAAKVHGAAWSPAATPKLPGPIVIEHSRGNLSIPPRMDCSPSDLYLFLLSRIPPQPPRAVPASLSDHLGAQVAKFGDDRVQLIHGRLGRMGPPRWRALGALGIAMLITGIVWLVMVWQFKDLFHSLTDRDGWNVGGWMCIIFGGLFWMIAAAANSAASRPAKQFRDGCIIISPASLAMVQGDLKGTLRWDEITGIKYVKGAKAILIHVHGGQILICDAYETSLDEIAKEIRRNMG